MRSTSPKIAFSLLVLSGSLLACAVEPAPSEALSIAATGADPGLRPEDPAADAPNARPRKGDEAGAPDDGSGSPLPASGNASSVFPAPHPGMPQIPMNGGVVLHDPALVSITFAGDALAQKIHAFGDQIGGLKWWSIVHQGYGVGPVASSGHVYSREQAPSSLTDGDVQRWIAARIGDGTLPPPTDQTIYTLYYPQSTVVYLDSAASCQVFLGYHSTITVNYRGQSIPIAYAVVNRCSGDIDQVTETASHEFTEAATDPHPIDGTTCGFVTLEDNAWTGLGGENGDMCASMSAHVENGWALTRVWNNVTAAAGDQPCLPAPDTRGLPYYNAGIVKEILSVPPGGTVSTEVDCYSFGPLPAPMALEARVAAKSPLKFGFDRRTCVNGDKITMTVGVPAGTPRGYDHRFSLVSSVGSDSAHLWRGIVHVQ